MLKGLFSHIFAKVIFVLCTYVIHLYLGKKLSAAEYGTIGVVISIITVNYNFLSNGVRQAVSKLLASKKYHERNLVARSFVTQMVVAFSLTFINFFCADLFASVLNAPEMAKYIRLSALMIPFTAGHFLNVGIINGLKLFVVEAFIVTIYPILRLTVIPYVSFVFSDSVTGTVMGFFTAAFLCFCGEVIYMFSKKSHFIEREEKVTSSVFIFNMTNFLIFFTCITIILNSDMLFVNALVKNENHVGYYTGAVNFAKVSYYLLSAVYIVVLPMISQFYAKKDFVKAKEIICVLNDVIALLILPIVSIVGATTSHMLTAFYKAEYVYASGTATVLMCSQFLIGLFVVLNMCISATQKNKFSTILALCIMVFDLLLCYMLVKFFGIIGAALASMIAGFFGCIISYIKVIRIYGNVFNKSTILLVLYNIFLFLILTIISKTIVISNLIVLLIIYVAIYTAFSGIIIFGRQIDTKKIISTLINK